MKTLFIVVLLLFGVASTVPGAGRPTVASWYGEDHRGRLMANGKPFDPDKLTAASWFYPLGTKVRVTLKSPVQVSSVPRSVLVTITDRSPARRLARPGEPSLRVPAFLRAVRLIAIAAMASVSLACCDGCRGSSARFFSIP